MVARLNLGRRAIRAILESENRKKTEEPTLSSAAAELSAYQQLLATPKQPLKAFRPERRR